MKKIYFTFSTSLLLLVTSAEAQQPSTPRKHAAGVSMGIVTSANGYGLRYEPMFFFRNKRTTLYGGILFESDKSGLSGAELKYEYALTGCTTPTWQRDKKEYVCNRKLELCTFVSGVYNQSGHLSSTVLREEKRPKEGEFVVKNYVFQSVEGYGGVSLKYRFLDRFKWTNSFGLGVCYTLNYPEPLYYDKCRMGLIYKTEITMRLTE